MELEAIKVANQAFFNWSVSSKTADAKNYLALINAYGSLVQGEITPAEFVGYFRSTKPWTTYACKESQKCPEAFWRKFCESAIKYYMSQKGAGLFGIEKPPKT
ncbi:MAG: hypothetical protein K2R98_15225 [Gemmataceae bacterium]|nr:hypothetical protein [Gemmataceae bacterium]